MKYKIFTLAILSLEIYIGTFIHDRVIRPYVGDLLVAVLLYCFVKSFVNTPVFKTAVGILVLCYTVEISQHFHLIYHLSLQNSRVAHLILGSYFSWIDMLCYTVGITAVLIVEFMETDRFNKQLSV